MSKRTDLIRRLRGQASTETQMTAGERLALIDRLIEAVQTPEEKGTLTLRQANFSDLYDAIVSSGVPINEAEAVANDFISDFYWQDPKCAGRRIRAEGGSSVRFFDALPQVDWGM